LREFAEEVLGERESAGDAEVALFGEVFEVIEEVGAGDVVGAVMVVGVESGGDDDGDEVAARDFDVVLDEVEEGAADAGGIEGEGGAAGELGVGEDAFEGGGDVGVGGAEGEALEVDETKEVEGFELKGDQVTALGGEVSALEDGEDGIVAVASEVESKEIVLFEDILEAGLGAGGEGDFAVGKGVGQIATGEIEA
jgi:hypothetical protein